jgi:hypothetical protein
MELIFLANAQYMLYNSFDQESITVDLEDPDDWDIIKFLYEQGRKENGI